MTSDEACTTIILVINKIMEDNEFCVKAKQTDAKARPGSCATVEMVSDLSNNFSDKKIITDDYSEQENVATIKNEYSHTIMLSILFFKNNALTNASICLDALNRESVKSILKNAKCALVKKSAIRNISRVVGKRWQEVAQFDVFINSVNIDSEDINLIKTASVEKIQ